MENRTAAILMYCEKQTIPSKRFEYMNVSEMPCMLQCEREMTPRPSRAACLQAFDTLTELFEGELPQFHPDPYPGLPVFQGSEHPDGDFLLLSTEFQVRETRQEDQEPSQSVCRGFTWCLRQLPILTAQFVAACSSSPTPAHSWRI